MCERGKETGGLGRWVFSELAGDRTSGRGAAAVGAPGGSGGWRQEEEGRGHLASPPLLLTVASVAAQPQRRKLQLWACLRKRWSWKEWRFSDKVTRSNWEEAGSVELSADKLRLRQASFCYRPSPGYFWVYTKVLSFLKILNGNAVDFKWPLTLGPPCLHWGVVFIFHNLKSGLALWLLQSRECGGSDALPIPDLSLWQAQQLSFSDAASSCSYRRGGEKAFLLSSYVLFTLAGRTMSDQA